MYMLSDYSYDLPEKLIAHKPVEPADTSKLLVYEASKQAISDTYFTDLPSLLKSNDVLFFNDTKVLPARIPLRNVRVVTRTGREVALEQGELFFLEQVSDIRFEWLMTLLKRNRPWMKIYIGDIVCELIELTDKGWIFELQGATVMAFLLQYGQMPLPPYIPYDADAAKHYQTNFAQHDWSVAAPTASLHFTPELLHRLKDKGIQQEFVTLHVWLWTFKPVDTNDIREYHIHEETMIIDISLFEKIAKLKQEWKNIVAVWTTVARVLETLPYVRKACAFDAQSYRDDITQWVTETQVENYVLSRERVGNKLIVKTRIFIYPGFHWRIVDSLITNFHLPQSTLLMLVASFMWYEQMKEIYAYAIAEHYRFYSFGDGMLLRN
jgi:S-adenosylmethionine:tRNA ribosyltransferase-isomerase